MRRNVVKNLLDLVEAEFPLVRAVLSCGPTVPALEVATACQFPRD